MPLLKASKRANKGPSANEAPAKKNSLLGEATEWDDVDADLPQELRQHTRILQEANLSPQFCSELLLSSRAGAAAPARHSIFRGSASAERLENQAALRERLE